MKKLEYTCPDVETIRLYSDDEIRTGTGTGDIIDVSQGTVEKPGDWVD